MTLNQVIKRLKTLAEAHKQVKHFAFEDAVSYLNDNSDINYPAIIVSDNPFSVSRTQKLTILNFNVYVLDLLDNAKNSLQNELDVYSDCLSIAEDYISMINASSFEDWYIGTESSAQFVKEAFIDYVGGVFFSITIGIEFLTDRCAVPTDYPFEPVPITNDMTVQKYTYLADGSEGDSLYTGLIGKYILLHVREKTVLDKIEIPGGSDAVTTASTIAPDEYVYDAATGYMYYMPGLDLQPGETIQIIWRNLI